MKSWRVTVCGLADTSRSMELDEIAGEKTMAELHLCVFLGRSTRTNCCRFKKRVMYKYTAAPTGNLHQRWVTDEHIILTESGVQKARSLHRVPLEERFVVSELKKVR